MFFMKNFLFISLCPLIVFAGWYEPNPDSWNPVERQYAWEKEQLEKIREEEKEKKEERAAEKQEQEQEQEQEKKK